jgi:hypothetical protein
MATSSFLMLLGMTLTSTLDACLDLPLVHPLVLFVVLRNFRYLYSSLCL